MSSSSSSSSSSSPQSSTTLRLLDMKGILILALLLLSFFLFPLSILTVLLRATLRKAAPFNIARNNLLSWLLDSALLSGGRRRVVSGYGKLGVVRCEREKAGSPSEPVECAICLCGKEEGKEIRELRCNHLFHRSCLDRWLEQQLTCPLCRDPLCSAAPREGEIR